MRASSQSAFPDDGAVLEVRELRKSFVLGERPAVDGLTFIVRSGEIVAILGPSGCGKTTTMRIIAGLEDADAGDVLLHGRSVLGTPAHRRNIGLVFQDLAIFPHMTVFGNVAFGLRMKGLRRAEAATRVRDMLRLVELPPEQFADRMPHTLSGGQRQRVALARTLVMRPDVVLFDEPMVSLDRRLRDRMVVEVRQIQKQLNIPAVYVTHDQESASTLADRIALMHDGRIVQVGTPLEIYLEPESRFVADFIGDMNLFPVRVLATNGKLARIDLFGNPVEAEGSGCRTGENMLLAVRPERLRLSRHKTALSIATGRLLGWHFSGGQFTYRVGLAGGTKAIVRQTESDFAREEGTELWLEAELNALRLLRD